MQDSVFEFFGLAAILGLAAALVVLVQHALGMPEVVHAITQFSPWAGANARSISWLAVGIVGLTAFAIPPIVMWKDVNDGGSRLATFGFAVWAALLIPSLGYLLYVGWFGAKHFIGP